MGKYKKLDGLYNKGVYWPPQVQAVVDHVLSYSYAMSPTNHATEKITQLNLPTMCYKSLLFGDPIEATFENGRLVKIVFRIANTKNCFQDICGAVRFNINEKDKNTASVITVWTNSNTDNHSTLKRENYAAY